MTENADAVRKCAKCGAPLAPDAPQGLCPRCLMAWTWPPRPRRPAPRPVPAARRGPPKPEPPPPLEEIARHFPQLEVLECLGRGGMGVVYKARQPRLDRLVALKILAREKEKDPRFAERFTREAQALARLNHPNIVTVHDFGQAGGLYYLLMEYVDGMSLRQLLQTRQAGAAGGAGHRAADLRGAPIRARARHRPPRHQAGEHPARQAGPGEDRRLWHRQDAGRGWDASQRSPASKEVVGTPHYMAPEQMEKPGIVDHRADIFSLGVVFYEMLTGELPLGKFAPPSQKVQVDVRLDEVVLHALEKEPERRYQQASQVKTRCGDDCQARRRPPPPLASGACLPGALPPRHPAKTGHPPAAPRSPYPLSA